MSYANGFLVSGPYLNLPVKNGAPMCLVSLHADGKKVREFEIELAEGEPDFWVFSDISEYTGKRLGLGISGFAGDPRILAAIEPSRHLVGGTGLYQERRRPQFHFSSFRGWLNDPNGLLYYKGEYHLFYQHNPYGWKWGNMHWGHAVSDDLVHWRELGDALYPDEMGTMYSGSGVVDASNTAGFQTGEESPLVLIYTAAGATSKWSEGRPFTQCLAFSNDRGRTWTKYAGNPVVDNIVGENRDPKVIWHEPSKHWIMALFLDGNTYALLISKDLKQWEKTCVMELPGVRECPDFFELPVDGDPGFKRWVYWGANGGYQIGTFDGRTFKPEGDVFKAHQGNHFYAAQTWSDIPEADGRRIQIGWARMNLPDMPFNQFMTFPTELTLRSTDEGVRLFTYPVKEVEKLHGRALLRMDGTVAEGENPLDAIQGELLDIQAEIEIGSSQRIAFTLRGVDIVYDALTQKLTCLDKTADMRPLNGKIHLRALVDRTSIEIYGNRGRVYMPMGVVLDDSDPSLAMRATGGGIRLASLVVYPLMRIW